MAEILFSFKNLPYHTIKMGKGQERNPTEDRWYTCPLFKKRGGLLAVLIAFVLLVLLVVALIAFVLVLAFVLAVALILAAFAVLHEDSSFQLIGAGFSLSRRKKLIHHKKKVEILVDKQGLC